MHTLRKLLFLLLLPSLLFAQIPAVYRVDFAIYQGNVSNSPVFYVLPADTSMSIAATYSYSRPGGSLTPYQPTVVRNGLAVTLNFASTANAPSIGYYELKIGGLVRWYGAISASKTGVIVAPIPALTVGKLQSDIGVLQVQYQSLSSGSVNITGFSTYTATVASSLAGKVSTSTYNTFLSNNAISTADINSRISSTSALAGVNATAITTKLNIVDSAVFQRKTAGLSLSENSYTSSEKAKLSSIDTGATSVTNNSQISNGAGYATTGQVSTTATGLQSQIDANVTAIGSRVLTSTYNTNRTTDQGATATAQSTANTALSTAQSATATGQANTGAIATHTGQITGLTTATTNLQNQVTANANSATLNGANITTLQNAGYQTGAQVSTALAPVSASVTAQAVLIQANQAATTSNSAAIAQRVTYVSDISSLTLTPGTVNVVKVRDALRGGDFTYAATGYTVDNGIVFPANGGGYWVRQFFGAANASWWNVSVNRPDNKNELLQAIATCSALNISLAFSDGTFLSSPLLVAVPITISLSANTVIKLINSASLINSELYLLKLTAPNSSITGGTCDFNRDGQDRATFNNNNATNSLSYSCVRITGTANSYLTNIKVDTRIINAVDRAISVQYVTDSSFPFIKVDNSGTGAVFENCKNLSIGKCLITRLDNKDWRIYPHAFDLFTSSDITIGDIIIQDQAGYSLISTQTTLSDWFSGVTITSCDNVNINTLNAVAKKDGSMMKSVGVSLLSNNNLKINNLEVRRYTDVNFEVGGCFKLSVNNFLIDGEYQQSSLWPTTKSTGINVYNNGYYSDFRSRSIRQSTECTFSNGIVRRELGYGGQFVAMSQCTFNNVDFIGNYSGAYFDSKNQNPSFSGVLVKKNRENRFINCKFNFNESRGVVFGAGTNTLFSTCQMINNGQAKTNVGSLFRHNSYGTFSGITYGFQSFDSATPGAERIGTRIVNSDAYDNQTITDKLASVSPTDLTTISVNDPSVVSFGQTIKLVGAGASGGDLLVQVVDINKDEVSISSPIITLPLVTGTGTISTAGTTITGTGTAFNTQFTGRLWIKVGTEYRQIIASSSATSATLGLAFSTNLDGQPFQIVSINIQQIRSQDIGIKLANSNDVLAIADGMNYGSSGNQTKNLQNDTGGNVTSGYDIKLPIVLSAVDFALFAGTPAIEVSSATGRRKGWSFDQATNESIQSALFIPLTFPDQIKVTYYWINNGTGTGSVAWDFVYTFLVDGADVGTAETFAGLLPQVASAREILKVSSFTTTVSVTKNSLMSFRVFRNASSAPDTLPNDALLLMVVISEG